MKFKRIYIEEGLISKIDYSVDDLMGHIINKTPILIRHYKDIFSRSNQDLFLQKKHPSLILAAKRPPFVFSGSKRCAQKNCGVRGQFYALPIMNCTMECEYCFLRGMYPTGNIVFFVNFEEIFPAIKSLLRQEKVEALALSYESDLLVLDRVLNCFSPWLGFAREVPETQFEVRTKAGAGSLRRLMELGPLPNVVLSWTISPPEVVRAFEARTPSFSSRLQAIKGAMEKGWRVRVCIDPILYIKSWEDIYGQAVSQVFSQIDPAGVEEVHIGVFRMGKRHLKMARKRYPNSQLLHYPYELRCDTFTYPMELEERLIMGVKAMLLDYLPPRKIRLIGEG